MFTRLISLRQSAATVPALAAVFLLTGTLVSAAMVRADGAPADTGNPAARTGPAPAVPAAASGAVPSAAATRTEPRNIQEVKLRALMTTFGAADLDTQDSVIAYIAQEEREHQPLRQRGRRLFFSIRDNTLSEADLRAQIDDFKAAVDADKTRHATAETALDDRVGYSKNPRLEGMLILLGIIGDGPLVIPYGQFRINEPSAPKTEKVSAETSDDRLAHEMHTALLKRFDTNKNGVLDDDERDAAIRFMQTAISDLGLHVDKTDMVTQIQASANTVPTPTGAANGNSTGNADTANHNGN